VKTAVVRVYRNSFECGSSADESRIPKSTLP
jgi:hypothetical protein